MSPRAACDGGDRRDVECRVGQAPVPRVLAGAQRELSLRESLKKRTITLAGLLAGPDGGMTAQVRASSALFTPHAGGFALQHVEGDDAAERAAVLQVALELLAAAHAADDGAATGPEAAA